MEFIKSNEDFVTSLEKALDEIDDKWREYPGIIVGGTHRPNMIEEKIAGIKKARENNLPFLGICFGHQLAAIEYARNILGIKNATSEEFGKGTFVVKKRNGLKVGLNGGQSYWNNYEVAIQWRKPENFITCQFHPEYQSSIDKPHPLLKEFIELCKSNAAGQNL